MNNFRSAIWKFFKGTLTALLLVFFWSPLPAADNKPGLQYARGFDITSYAGSKLVTLKIPWHKGVAAPMRYLLVPRGEQIPAVHPPAQVIHVPVRRVVALSTTHLAYIDAAGMTDRLAGVADFKTVNTPAVRRRIDAGQLKEVGHALKLNIEALMDLSPDVILTTASGSIYDVHPKLAEAGLPAVLIIDHLERHPLGRLEWIKFMGLLFDTGDHAQKRFDDIARKYQTLAKKTAESKFRPKIISGTPFQGQWYVAKADSFVAQFIRDAGGTHLWPDIPGTGSQPMDIEMVYARALDADFWLNPGTWRQIADGLAADPRFADVQALKTGHVFNNDRRLNKWGGNDFWESGMLHPDWVLADVVAILHPEILPDHELVYYRKLGG